MKRLVSLTITLILGLPLAAHAKASAEQVQQSKTAVSLVSEVIFLKQQRSEGNVPETYFYQARKRITDEILKLSNESIESTPDVANLLRKADTTDELPALMEIQKQLLELEKKYGQSA